MEIKVLHLRINISINYELDTNEQFKRDNNVNEVVENSKKSENIPNRFARDFIQF